MGHRTLAAFIAVTFAGMPIAGQTNPVAFWNTLATPITGGLARPGDCTPRNSHDALNVIDRRYESYSSLASASRSFS